MPSGSVGIIVNPVAGKDIRRLVSGADHTSDVTKMGIVTRVVAAAAESGAKRIVLADDPHRLARRAVERLTLDNRVEIELLSDHVTGTRHDTVSAAAEFADDVDVVVVLGGDGTCRDVATGWPDAPTIAMSTGTNNVFPSAVDGTSAGVAAGLVASGAVDIDRVARTSKRIVVRIDPGDGRDHIDDVALVDLALIEATFVGARAVRDPATIRAVVAAIADPGSTGLSSIAGRVHPVDRWAPGGVLVRLAHGSAGAIRQIRVPLSPGTFDSLDVAEIVPLGEAESIEWQGPGVLAFDGERHQTIGETTTVTIHIEQSGPRVIDVARTLACAARRHAFDVSTHPVTDPHTAPHTRPPTHQNEECRGAG